MKVRSPTIIQYIISAINISGPEDFLQKEAQKAFTHMRASDHRAMLEHKRHPATVGMADGSKKSIFVIRSFRNLNEIDL